MGEDLVRGNTFSHSLDGQKWEITSKHSLIK